MNIVKIQASYIDSVNHEKVQISQEKDELSQRIHSAATIIQKHVRGYLARKSHLSRNLYPLYRGQCERVNGPAAQLMPRADSGKTTVYLPQEMPGIVLKNSGRECAIRRFHQMQQVRSILVEQNSSHLIIPKANLCQEFLVEERLPINTDSYHNMALYLAKPELFDEAVREFTRLFSRAYLADLVGYVRHPLVNIAGVMDVVRYDNLPLYVVEKMGQKVGNIGLIDLEHLRLEPDFRCLQTLVRIFPHHLDIIINEARKLEIEIEIDKELLNKYAEKGKKYLQVGFGNHLAWLKQKGVTPETGFHIDAQRVTDIAVLLEKELLKTDRKMQNLMTPFMCVGKASKTRSDIAKELAGRMVPLIIGNLKEVIVEAQNRGLHGRSDQSFTEADLVRTRSPEILRHALYKGMNPVILKSPKSALRLVCFVMEELVKGGELFYFDTLGGQLFLCGPVKKSKGNSCWIRY